MARRVVQLPTRGVRHVADGDATTGEAAPPAPVAVASPTPLDDAPPEGSEGFAPPRHPGADREDEALRRARPRRRRGALAASAGAAAERAARAGRQDATIASDTAATTRPGRRAGADPFAERLRALEREIDEVLAGAEASADHGLVTAARGAAEELVAFYADLARAVRRGGVAEAFIRLRMIGAAERVDDFGYDAAFAARMAPLLEFLYQRWWRVGLEGVEHVPPSGRVLLVANHSGGFFPYDALMLAHGIGTRPPGGGREVRPLIEDFVYRFPFVGPVLTRLGAVRASPENAERLLGAEHAVAVFPEGAKGVGKYYRDRYRLQRFARGGFVTLALRTGAPLVPVAIIGAEEIHPVIAKWQWLARLLDLPYVPVTPTFPWLGALGLIPLPTKWRIVFGPPLDVAAEHGRDAAEDDLLVNRLKERVREQVHRMIVEALRARDSVFT